MTEAALQPVEGAATACPGCRAPMRRQSFASRGFHPIDLDICFDCHAFWFKPLESAQLAPGAVLELFKVIQERKDPARPLAGSCACPVCHHALSLTHDFERTNRITYYRCGSGHGRFTTFMQFMLEKNFVRTLSPAEMGHLRAVVAQVKCSSCGAPIDLGRDTECSYCHAPITVLDADAVGKTVAELTAQEKPHPPMDSVAAVNALLVQGRAQPVGDANALEPIDLVRAALSLLVDIAI